MNKKLTYKLCLILTIASLGLSGCGGSSSSTPNSTSSTIVQISNGSQFDIAEAVIASPGGSIVLNEKFNCSSMASECYINLNQDIDAGSALLFRDANQRLISAVVMANSVNEYIALNPSAASTGFYLMTGLSTELSKESGIGWDELNQRVLTFFTNYDSPDGTADPYEEVGLYYASQLTKGISSERKFYDAFKLRLINWDVAANNELPGASSNLAGLYETLKFYLKGNSFAPISSAFAQGGSCAPALKTFLSLTSNLGKVIPVVGEGVAGTAKLASSYCDGAQSGQLNQIVSQLNDLQNSIDKVASNLSDLSKFLFDQAANNKTVEFQKIAQDTRALSANYNRFLINNGNVKSLQEFFTKAGGWDQGIQKGGAALASILNSPYSSSSNGGLYTRITSTTSFADFNTYLQALKNRCDDLNTSSSDNFIVTRQQCNNIILANSGMLVAAQGIALPIFKDIYATLNAYQANAQNNYLLPDGLNSYATAYGDAVENFANQQTKMIADYKDSVGTIGFFDAFAGLDTALTAAMTSRQCNQSGADRSNFPAIIGWYAPTTNPKQNYLETNCKKGDQSQRIKARYYTGDQGNVDANDVVNVLGVLVASDYTKTNNFFYKPLYLTTDNRTKAEQFADRSGDENGLYIETRSASGASGPLGAMTFPETPSDGVISPNLSWDSNGYYNIGNRPVGSVVALYVLVKSQSDYYRVARLGVVYQANLIYGFIDCIAAPCRVDPTTNQWIIFTEDGGTLDFRPTNRKWNNVNIGTLGPAGQ